MSDHRIMIPQKADFHMHTVFCDGKNTAEEMVLKGIEIGLSVIGFSVHSPLDHDKSGWCIRPDKTEAYRAEIHRLRDQYADKIRIYCGIEQDYFSKTSVDSYDYVIGSVHSVFKDGEYVDVDHSVETSARAICELYDGDIYAYAEAYYALVADVVRQTNADIIGHFDLLTKFQDRGLAFDPENPRYIAAWKRAADQLLQTGKPFEINTGAISRGYRKMPYPALDIMKYLAEHGGKAVITSDSHSTDALGTAFTLAHDLAHEAGLPLVRKIGNIEF